MVFCFKTCYDQLWEKILVMFPRTIHSKSESSEQLMKQNIFYLLLERFKYLGTIKMTIGTNNWDLETSRNKLEKSNFHSSILLPIASTNTESWALKFFFFLFNFACSSAVVFFSTSRLSASSDSVI